MHLRSIFPVPVVAGMLSFVLVEALGGCASRTSGAGGAADNYAVAVPSLPVVPLHLDRGSDDRGLQELVRAIGDARVVMLGEQWHGDGGAIRVRSELVRVLHERLGFDVLAFEADFYSLHRGWDAMRASGDIRAMAGDNVYHFWSLSSASDGLWRYIDAQRFTNRPLSVAGIDPRHLGALARTTLPDELDKRLAADVIGATSEERRRFRVTLEGLLSNEFRRPSPSDQDEFLRELDRLAAALSARDSASRDSFWEQEVRNVRNAALYVWRGASRDRAMGENLAWLATHAYPGRKIIVWAHNNHIIKDKWMYFASPDTLVTGSAKGRTLESIARSTYLGHEARQFFGPTVFSLAVLSYRGTYSPDVRTENLQQRGNFDSLAVLSAAPEGTIEATIAHAGYELAFVNLRQAPPAALPARVLDYSRLPPMRMRYNEGFDAFVFIRSTFGLNEQPPAAWPGGGRPDR